MRREDAEKAADAPLTTINMNNDARYRHVASGILSPTIGRHAVFELVLKLLDAAAQNCHGA